MKKVFGLGKGLESLIPKSKQMQPDSQKENVFYVEINKIRANPDQPRQDFDNDGLKELSRSIRKYGVLQPLLVSKVEEESSRGLNVFYQLIAGERRLRASKLAGLPHVPVVIRNDFRDDKSTSLEIAIIENVQRKDLNPMEEAEAYDRLMKEFKLTQQDVAVKVGKSREVVANAVRLLNLPQDIRESLRAGVLSRAHARALLAFNDESRQREVYKHIIGGRLSSKEVEKMASFSKPKKSSATSQEVNRFQSLEKNLGEMLKVPVLIRSNDKGGHIMIKFATLQELNKVAKMIID